MLHKQIACITKTTDKLREVYVNKLQELRDRENAGEQYIDKDERPGCDITILCPPVEPKCSGCHGQKGAAKQTTLGDNGDYYLFARSVGKVTYLITSDYLRPVLNSVPIAMLTYAIAPLWFLIDICVSHQSPLAMDTSVWIRSRYAG
jgi:hypothetical protein